MSERMLRPKEKRKVSSMLNDSVVYAEDPDTPALASNSKRSRKGSDVGKKKKSIKKKPNNAVPMQPKPKDTQDFDFSKLDSEEDENTLVIDDPNAYYQDEYNSEEERRKRNAEKKEREEEHIRMEETLKKKKKTRHANIGVKKYRQVPMDENGRPIMPISLGGSLTIYDLGKIVHDRKKFHAKRYIWPVGFKSSRVYCSMTNLQSRCEYVSEIIDGDTEPRFLITCYEDPKNPTVIEAATASGAWAQVGKRIADLKEALTGKKMFTQLSGPELFGFSHPTIAKLIQEMPNAELCDKYIAQQYAPSTTTSHAKKGKRPKKKVEEEEEEDDDEEDDAQPKKKRRRSWKKEEEDEDEDEEDDEEYDDDGAGDSDTDADEGKSVDSESDPEYVEDDKSNSPQARPSPPARAVTPTTPNNSNNKGSLTFRFNTSRSQNGQTNNTGTVDASTATNTRSAHNVMVPPVIPNLAPTPPAPVPNSIPVLSSPTSIPKPIAATPAPMPPPSFNQPVLPTISIPRPASNTSYQPVRNIVPPPSIPPIPVVTPAIPQAISPNTNTVNNTANNISNTALRDKINYDDGEWEEEEEISSNVS
jgi:hypothetical protein